MRLITILLLLCCLSAAVQAAVCDASGDEFTMVFVMDPHCANSAVNCASMASWVSANKTGCNMKFIALEGDYVNAQSPELQSEWDTFITNMFTTIQAVGLPTVYVVGNHDVGSGAVYTFSDTTFANAKVWDSCYPDCSHPRNQFQKFSVSTSRGSYKFAALSLDYMTDPCVSAGVPGPSCTGASANGNGYATAQPGTWAKGIMDAVDSQTQVFYLTHMMVSGGTSGNPAGIFCNSFNVGFCNGGGIGAALGFGNLQWDNFVSRYSQFRWTINGHDAFYPTSFSSTNVAGKTVFSFGEKGASGDTGVCALVLKFRPATSDIAVWFVDWTGAAGFRTFASTTWAWDAQLTGVIFPMPMPVIH